MKKILACAVLALGSAMAISGAPTAHADDQAFMNDTQDYHVCTDMRAGMPRQAALHDGFANFNLINDANVKIVDAA